MLAKIDGMCAERDKLKKSPVKNSEAIDASL
jgi:hypothetical protein